MRLGDVPPGALVSRRPVHQVMDELQGQGPPGPPQSPATNTSPSKRISTPGVWAPLVKPGTWRVR
jgi:hypothetical protein